MFARRNLCVLLSVLLTLILALPGMAEGQAQVVEIDSMGGPMKVSVTVDGETITAVEVLEQHDTDGIADWAVARIPGEIVAHQSVNVDSVSGATLTSSMLKRAVTQALTEIYGSADAYKESAPYLAEAQTDMTADIVVVGGGIAGLSAAGYAASKGQNVVLLEKSGVLGGAATVSGAGMTSGITEPVLSKFEWMRDLYVGMGVDLQPTSFPGYEQIKGAIVPSTENRYGGARLIDGLIDICRNNNVTILMDTPATGLVTENGVVTGVTAQPRGQEPFTVTAGSVILATGGFGHNADMIAEYMPQFKGVWMANPVGSVGDAISWVRELGAKLVDLDSNANFHSVNPATGYRAVTGQLWLDAEGNNFSEVNDYSTSTRDAWLQMGNEKYYILSTAEYLESAKSESDLAHDIMSGSVVKYDSMEAVMEACGMPNLPETLAAHELADASSYYVSPARAALYSTYGGIGVDDVGHVLTEADEPIPHLYAVGEVIGSKDYQVNGFYVGQLGQAMTMAALAVDDITNG